MKREYKFNRQMNRNKDNIIATICVVIAIVICLSKYFYCKDIVSETDSILSELDKYKNISVENEDAEDPNDTPITEEELMPTIVSMAEAGNTIANMQNQMIVENNNYITTVKTARDAGYDDPIMMPDSYKTLLEDFKEQYMPSGFAGAQGVVWSVAGTWEFNADYDYSANDIQSMPAVWTCYLDDDIERKNPCAYVTATYVTESGMFIDPVLHKTEVYPYIISESDDNYDDDPCDQTYDEVTMHGDDGEPTPEQLEIFEKLQKIIDSNDSKNNAVVISH